MAEFLPTITEQVASNMTAADAQKLIKGMCISRAAIAVETLEQICRNVRANPAARVSAATALLDRGFGKPEQNTTVIVPGSGRAGVMLVPSTAGREQWLAQASAHHKKMLT
jgi:hypothetical protein